MALQRLIQDEHFLVDYQSWQMYPICLLRMKIVYMLENKFYLIKFNPLGVPVERKRHYFILCEGGGGKPSFRYQVKYFRNFNF